MNDTNETNNSDHVKVFGQDVTGGGRRRGNAVFGLFILFIGGVLLLNNFGIVPWNFWDFIWIFWPVIFILIGIRAIFGRSVICSLIVSLLAAAIFLTVLIFGLEKVNSPLVTYFPPSVVEFVNTLTSHINRY